MLDDNNLKALVSLLSDDDKDVLSMIESQIIALGDTIIPYLEKEWESTFSPSVQKRIEDLIHALQLSNLKKRLIVWKDEGAQNILEGMWIISTYQYPDLEFAKLNAQVEQLYFDVWVEMKPENEAQIFEKIKALNFAFFNKLKFSANTKNFHAVGNSMINIVLENKKGNPITLCVLYMLIAQRLKMPIYGVNLPNLFILTYKSEDTQFYINAFNKGLIFSKADIDNYISHLNLTKNDIFYEPCSNLEIIKRVLRNIIISFEKTGETEKVDEIKELLASISDENELENP